MSVIDQLIEETKKGLKQWTVKKSGYFTWYFCDNRFSVSEGSGFIEKYIMLIDGTKMKYSQKEIKRLFDAIKKYSSKK